MRIGVVPLQNDGSVNLKHVFILVSLDDATFTGYQGLLSGLLSGDILTTNNSGTYFFNFGADEYRKSDVIYGPTVQAAPVAGQVALVEIIYNAGVAMDGLQYGKQRNNSPARLLKGYFFEGLGYSGIKNTYERLRIYRYFAMRYQTWSKVASGLYVFPFPADKVASRETDVEHYLSEPYSGNPKALLRGDFKDAMSTQYSLRIQQEYDAAKAFFKQHQPLTHFVLRDYRYDPFTENEVRFASSVKEQGSNVSYRFNYAFDTIDAI